MHHDVDVGEDGTVYAIQQDRVAEMPKGLERIPAPTTVDSVVMLSPEGKLLRGPISILEAFRDSPYAGLLSAIETPKKRDWMPGFRMPRVDMEARKADTLHTNSIKVLPRALAPKFPTFKSGQVLVSMRHLDTIAVLDVERRSVVWAARGPWQAQHDAQFLENGHLLLFDNIGSPRGSRVLEYDPQTQALPWIYAGEERESFFSTERGLCQRLPNGNTFIVNSQGGELLEVSPGKEPVWACSLKGFINAGRRYSPDQVRFLTKDQHARP
jgi:hypothetical protein